eukprot:SAG11_NODE_110_length_16199_cov_18.081180_16_plen_352_part_00
MSHRDNFSDASSDDDDSWEQRAWRTRIQKISYRYDYDRKKLPYRNFVPQVPFYIHLGQPRRGPKSKGARAPQLRVRMPDTVVFGLGPDPGCNGVMKTWLFNSAEGIICRRDDFSDTDVMTRFKNEEPRAIVAVMKRPLGAAQGTQLVLLNSEDLAETLYNRDNYGLFCIQAYVPPRKGRCFLARSVWRRDGGGNGFIHECFFMTAKRSFLESGSLDDLHLNLEACDSAVVTAVNGAVAEGLEGMSTAVKSYMEKALTPSIDVEELVIDYTKDSNGRVSTSTLAGRADTLDSNVLRAWGRSISSLLDFFCLAWLMWRATMRCSGGCSKSSRFASRAPTEIVPTPCSRVSTCS